MLNFLFLRKNKSRWICGRKKFSFCVGGNVNWCNPYRKIVLKNCTYVSSIKFLGSYPKNTKVLTQENIGTPLLTQALVTIIAKYK